jgi:hypothetical protein
MSIVDDLVADINGRPMERQGFFHGADGAFDPSAKASWRREAHRQLWFWLKKRHYWAGFAIIAFSRSVAPSVARRYEKDDLESGRHDGSHSATRRHSLLVFGS